MYYNTCKEQVNKSQEKRGKNMKVIEEMRKYYDLFLDEIDKNMKCKERKKKMSKTEITLLKEKIAESLLKEKLYRKCKFLYFKKDSSDDEYSLMHIYESIILLDNVKLEKLLIIVSMNDISINRVPLTPEYENSIYYEIE